MKKFIILENEGKENNFIIDPEELLESTYVDGRFSIIINKKESDVQALNDALQNRNDSDDIQEWIENQDLELEGCPEWHLFEPNMVVFDWQGKEFFMSDILENCNIYKWWDGSNHQTIEVDSYQEIEVYEDSFSLDEWDGNNVVTGGIGNHVDIYKTVDDEVLWYASSQWQGSHDRGEILSLNEFKERLEELDRDPENYLKRFNLIEEK